MYADIVVCFVNLNYKLMHLPLSAWTTPSVRVSWLSSPLNV